MISAASDTRFFISDNAIDSQKGIANELLIIKKMFQRNHLDTLPYPISPNDVYLYEDQLLMNIINVFLFCYDEGRARRPLVVRGKTTNV